MPRDVTRIDFEGVFDRSDNPNQVREFNYVFGYDVMDTETGMMIAEGEYRTVASDVPLNLDVAKDMLTELIETNQT
jgi:hypothetical protein